MKKLFYFLPLILAVAGIFLSLTKTRSRVTVGAPETNSNQNFKADVFVENLNVPWSMAFTSQDRLLVTERRGQIRVIEKGKLLDRSLFTFGNIFSKEEAGLMGLAVDPDYQKNRFIYASYAYSQNGKPRIKVVRLIDNGSSAMVDKVLIDNILAAPFHDGSRLKFGPDGKLYVTTGEATQADLAQKLDSVNGKILRLNSDGSIPEDNPFPDSPIYSYGHRNPQGIAWSPISGMLWETEHGPSGFDGPGGGDEINLIKAGGNYGWPKAHHEIELAGTEYPQLLFTPAIAPSGATFYSGKLLPGFRNNLFFTGLRGEGIWRVAFSETEPDKIVSFEKLSSIKVGRVRDIIEGPDGALYFSTSNRDGRGTPREGDDKIYKITPQ